VPSYCCSWSREEAWGLSSASPGCHWSGIGGPGRRGGRKAGPFDSGALMLVPLVAEGSQRVQWRCVCVPSQRGAGRTDIGRSREGDRAQGAAVGCCRGLGPLAKRGQRLVGAGRAGMGDQGQRCMVAGDGRRSGEAYAVAEDPGLIGEQIPLFRHGSRPFGRLRLAAGLPPSPFDSW
jgi:hypothetical protein